MRPAWFLTSLNFLTYFLLVLTPNESWRMFPKDFLFTGYLFRKTVKLKALLSRQIKNFSGNKRIDFQIQEVGKIFFPINHVFKTNVPQFFTGEK